MIKSLTAHDLVYYSKTYLKFIQQAFPKVDVYKLGSNSDGFMYACALKSDNGRLILNSLPFFGGHGGPFNSGTLDGQRNILNQYIDLASELDAWSATIVENPFDPLDQDICRDLGLNIVDDRIGQFTNLPSLSSYNERDLYDILHVKTRNAVRKGFKLPIRITLADSDADWVWMQSVHAASISAMGGLVKSPEIFGALRAVFKDKVKLHICWINNARVAGLVCIEHHETIEYFTPVVEPDYRETQVLSALIFSIMDAAVKNGYKFWNWGGTWRSQSGVYRFKKRFGAFDAEYRYFNIVLNENIKRIPKKTLQSEFPYFYTYRYNNG